MYYGSIMKYEVEIQGRQVSIELEQRNGRVQARVGPREYNLEVVSPEEGVYTFLAGDRVYEARVWAPEPNSLNVTIGGHLFSTSIIDRKHRRSTIEHGIEGRQNLVAPMPGKVVRVLLGAGDEVTLGQGVVVVEAMKMQNEIKSPKTGRVIEVRVIEGATVNANQVLAVVE
jgi:biotin carboxyl carrier protein